MWEEEILNWAYELAQSMGEALLEKIDEELMKGKEEGLKMEGLRERWVTTLFGDVKIRPGCIETVLAIIAFFWMKQWGLEKGARQALK